MSFLPSSAMWPGKFAHPSGQDFPTFVSQASAAATNSLEIPMIGWAPQ